MASVTFQIPSEVRKLLSKHLEFKWAKVIADALRNYARKLWLMYKISAKNKLSNQDIDVLIRRLRPIFGNVIKTYHEIDR